jgi:adenine-specific DNA-methyltransferase
MATIQFKGKEIVRNHHLTVPYHELVPDDKRSLTKKVSLNDNLIIHGDNLLALKALLPTYGGKVQCIYIDPPYNIGNENWVYNDRVNSPMMKEWLGKIVDKDDLTRHDKWLCMMMPRLKLLRELLCDEGAIFISIDDTEQHRLRLLADDVFGEDNFITNIIWQKKYAAASDARFFSDNHDFIIVYAKNKALTEKDGGWARNLLPRTEKQDSLYKYDDNDGKGLWRPDNLTVKTYSKEYDYPIINPNTDKIYFPTKGRCWATNPDTMKQWIEEKRVFFGKNGKGAPQLKRYLKEVQEGIVPLTIWTYDEVGHSDSARKELKEIFADEKLPFDNPKPTGLIKRVIQIAAGPGSIVLDSFSGSGTSAHANLALNQDDSGNRKFILVECEDYADRITAERVRRVIKGVKNAKDENLKNGLGGTFSYYELGKPIDAERILKGKDLPTFIEMARYVFYSATGEEFNEKKIEEKKGFIGESKEYQVYLLYKPDMEFLKSTALTLDRAESLGKFTGKKRLVFAPAKYLDKEHLERLHIDFAQLPFEIYQKQ